MAEQFSVVQSLFGLTPTNVQNQMDAEADRRAMELATLSRSPAAASEYYGLRSAERFRNAPIFGKTPRVAQAESVQTVIQSLQSQGVDMSTPEGMIQLASELNKNPEFSGMAMALRQEAAKLAQSQNLTQAEIFKRTAEGAKALKENAPPTVKTSEEFARVANELGYGVKPNLADYSQEQTKAINAEMERRGIKKTEAGANKVVIEGQKNVLKIDEDDAKEYRTAKVAAAKAIPVLNNMKKLVDSGIIVGTLPDARTGFLRALDTLGVSTAEAKKTVANTEQFNNQVRLLLQSIIKQFGYNPSNADVKFALESLPNNTNSPDGLKAIIDALIRANQTQLNESTRALDYYRKNNGSFSGFTPNYDAFTVGGTKQPSEMTTEEIRAELARRRAQQAKP